MTTEQANHDRSANVGRTPRRRRPGWRKVAMIAVLMTLVGTGARWIGRDRGAAGPASTNDVSRAAERAPITVAAPREAAPPVAAAEPAIALAAPLLETATAAR
ncbi:MAG: hypothetical protein KDC98_03550, partial [Planctomycetes bacterium]|nr:hypothetical protein [Planctomycetota bacterium]